MITSGPDITGVDETTDGTTAGLDKKKKKADPFCSYELPLYTIL